MSNYDERYNELKENFLFTGITIKGDSISFSFLNKETSAVHVPMAYLQEAQTEEVMGHVDKMGFMMLNFLNYIGRSYLTQIGFDYQEKGAEPNIINPTHKFDFRTYYKSEERILTLASCMEITSFKVNDLEQKINIKASYYRSLSNEGFIPDEKPTKLNIPSIWMDLDYEGSSEKDRYFLFAPELKATFNAIKEIAFDVLELEAAVLGKMAEINKRHADIEAKAKEAANETANEPTHETDEIPV